jgi:site-specific DNA-methyltransferase (adenine-specific)
MDAIQLPTNDDPVTVVEGDCLEVLRALPDGCVHAVITDPPYGINLRDNSQGGRHGRRRPAGENAIVGDETTDLGITVLGWCRERNLPTVAFASPRLPWPGKWSSLLVWDKGGAVGGGGDVKRCWKQTWELIQVARTGELREGRDAAVLRYTALPKLSAVHPAAKPVDLMRYLIRQTTDPGDLILDPFAGSGTTGVAAALEGRRCLLIEKVPTYAAICRERVAKALGADKGSLFAGT